MINFEVVDFSERRSEEVISFFWRSVYRVPPPQKKKKTHQQQLRQPMWSKF